MTMKTPYAEQRHRDLKSAEARARTATQDLSSAQDLPSAAGGINDDLAPTIDDASTLRNSMETLRDRLQRLGGLGEGDLFHIGGGKRGLLVRHDTDRGGMILAGQNGYAVQVSTVFIPGLEIEAPINGGVERLCVVGTDRRHGTPVLVVTRLGDPEPCEFDVDMKPLVQNLDGVRVGGGPPVEAAETGNAADETSGKASEGGMVFGGIFADIEAMIRDSFRQAAKDGSRHGEANRLPGIGYLSTTLARNLGVAGAVKAVGEFLAQVERDERLRGIRDRGWGTAEGPIETVLGTVWVKCEMYGDGRRAQTAVMTMRERAWDEADFVPLDLSSVAWPRAAEVPAAGAAPKVGEATPSEGGRSFAAKVLARAEHLKGTLRMPQNVGDVSVLLAGAALRDGAECWSIGPSLAAVLIEDLEEGGTAAVLQALQRLEVPENGVWIEVGGQEYLNALRGPMIDTGVLAVRDPDDASVIRIVLVRQGAEGEEPVMGQPVAVSLRPTGDPRPSDMTPEEWTTVCHKLDARVASLPSGERRAVVEVQKRMRIGIPFPAPGQRVSQHQADDAEWAAMLVVAHHHHRTLGTLKTLPSSDRPTVTRIEGIVDEWSLGQNGAEPDDVPTVQLGGQGPVAFVGRIGSAIVTPEDAKTFGLKNPVVLAVGQPVPAVFRSQVPSEGGFALRLGRSALLTISGGVPEMTEKEAQAARKAPMTVGLLRHGDALFLCIGIPGLGEFDLPYDHRRVRAQCRGIPDRKPHQGLALEFLPYDTKTGILKGLRLLSLTPEFCAVLEKEIVFLDKHVGSADWSYERDVRRAYQRWPNSKAMLGACTYVEQAGMPFTSERPELPKRPGSN